MPSSSSSTKPYSELSDRRPPTSLRVNELVGRVEGRRLSFKRSGLPVSYKVRVIFRKGAFLHSFTIHFFADFINCSLQKHPEGCYEGLKQSIMNGHNAWIENWVAHWTVEYSSSVWWRLTVTLGQFSVYTQQANTCLNVTQGTKLLTFALKKRKNK